MKKRWLLFPLITSEALFLFFCASSLCYRNLLVSAAANETLAAWKTASDAANILFRVFAIFGCVAFLLFLLIRRSFRFREGVLALVVFHAVYLVTAGLFCFFGCQGGWQLYLDPLLYTLPSSLFYYLLAGGFYQYGCRKGRAAKGE